MTANLDADATKLNAQNPQYVVWAKKLDEAKFVYALYGALDGLSLSYSMVKYLFDLHHLSGASDAMHDWMMTPGGALAAGAESITIMAFSLMANLFKDDDSNRFNHYISILWPYCRDTAKGLKNGYKGVRGTLQVAGFLSGTDFRHLIVPVGIGLGALSVLSRTLMRAMVTGRKAMMKKNAELLQAIQQSAPFDETQGAAYLAQLDKEGRQYERTRKMALLGAFFGGVVDGLYLYMGTLSLAPISAPLLIAMSACCVLFTLSNIITRIYEEYNYQRVLIVGQKKIELAVCGKELEHLYDTLQTLFNPLDRKSYEGLLHNHSKKLQALDDKIKAFSEKQQALHALLNVSQTMAVLTGLQNGLFVYSALSSVVYAVATINAMLAVPFPPFLLVSTVLLGLVSLIGCITHAVYQNHQHLRAKETPEYKPHPKWSKFIAAIEQDKEAVRTLEPEHVKEAIFDGMMVDPSPQFFFQEWCEVVRSFFSGIGKGQKSVDYTLNAWQDVDEQGHCHDTPEMLAMTVVSSAVYASGLALRAFARGLSRDPIDTPPPAPVSTPVGEAVVTPQKPPKPARPQSAPSHLKASDRPPVFVPDFFKHKKRAHSLPLNLSSYPSPAFFSSKKSNIILRPGACPKSSSLDLIPN